MHTQDTLLVSGDSVGNASMHLIKPLHASGSSSSTTSKPIGSESQFTKFALRLQAPVRALALNHSGYRLAVGGECGSLRIVNTTDTSQVQTIVPVTNEPVLHLAFDSKFHLVRRMACAFNHLIYYYYCQIACKMLVD
jgi:hypothetical protein